MRMDDIWINKLWSCTDATIINTAVVSTNISHDGNSLNPGCKHIFWWIDITSIAVFKLIIFNQLRKSSVAAGFHIFNSFWYSAERHNLDSSPYRNGSIVIIKVMFYKTSLERLISDAMVLWFFQNVFLSLNTEGSFKTSASWVIWNAIDKLWL